MPRDPHDPTIRVPQLSTQHPALSTRFLLAVACLTLCASAGCGTDVTDLAVQAGSSAAFTLLDIFLTDAANSIVQQNRPAPANEDADDDDAADGDGDGNGGDDGPGDLSPGEQAYVAQDCGVCHGGNAEGASAPAMAGLDELDALNARFADGAAHYGKSLSDQEITDVAAWLLGDDATGDGGADAVAAGAEAFAAGTCPLCHGADAGGGAGPTLAGLDEQAALEARFADGASHNGNTLTDQEIADVAAWLAGL